MRPIIPVRALRVSARPVLSTSSRAFCKREFSSAINRAPSRLLRFAALAAGAGIAGGLTLAMQDQLSAEAAPRLPSSPDLSNVKLELIEDSSAPMRERMAAFVKLLQKEIVDALQKEEQDGSNAVYTDKNGKSVDAAEGRKPASFIVEAWKREQGGEGISCVIQDGVVFEKGGVNVSVVHGQLPPSAIRQMSADHGELIERVGYVTEGPNAQVDSLPFFATGISLVIHPKNPFAPTSHLNYRYFELGHPEKLRDGSPNPRYNPNEPAAWWFGGGSDLTPMYLYEEDAEHFHKTVKAAADSQDKAFYPAWKKWCDSYFWITHRDENRGVGGVFFDDVSLPSWSKARSYIPLQDGSKHSTSELVSSLQHDKDSLFSTMQALGHSYVPSYVPLVHKRKNEPYNEDNVEWQRLRRGRYAEFNLVYDRGTKFGLMTPGARMESILMSLPLHARWEYMEPSSGTGREHSVAAAGRREEAVRTTPADELKAREIIQSVLEKPREWA
ncbi:coproporphyrinogen oxidase [Malassezia cuniculi]|uniref:coproporphyrinogen oxidase n=1 Tax=Malassezia cuniculi TaxID=948313 RepID=A0AAF0ETL7_9BASI|nr:coproporphyrinogen oxidase [Malassezia cuniculi]